MARSPSPCAFAVVALSYALLRAETITTQDTGVRLVVEDPRPVAKAMVILEHHYRQPITYEEGPYVYQDELNDLTLDANASRRILSPKAWRIDSDIRLPSDATKADLVNLISRFLGAAAKSRGVTRDSFRVLQSTYGLHVVPTLVRDRDGAEQPVTPLLDVQITLTQRADLFSILQSFRNAVSEASGEELVLATIPRDFARRSAVIVAENERARDVLIRLLEAQGLVLSWHLLYGATDNAFFLSIGHRGRLMGPLK